MLRQNGKVGGKRGFIAAATAAAAASLFASSLLPQARVFGASTWDGGGSTDNWNDASNWDDNLVPSFPVGITFAGVTRLTPSNTVANTAVQGIWFDASAGAFTLGGSSINLGVAGDPLPLKTAAGPAVTGGITNSSTNAQIVNLPLTLIAGKHGFQTDSGAGNLTLGGAITRQTGATAAFYISGGNITTPLTNDASGIIGGWAITGNAATVASWATRDLTGNIVPLTNFSQTFSGDVTFAGTTATSNVDFTGGGNATLPAATTLNTLRISDQGGTVRTITNQGATVFTAGGGILRNNDAATAQHLITGGSITAGTVGPAELFIRTRTSPQGALTGPPEGLNIASQITNNAGGGAVTVVKYGYGVLRLDTASNTFSGGFYLNEGQLRPSQPNSMGTGPVFVAADAQMLQGGAVTQPNNFFISGFGPQENGFRGGALRFNSAGGVLSGTITLQGDARIGARGGQATGTGPGGTLSGQVTGGFALELNKETGQGTAGLAANMPTITLSNSNNNWSGDTTIGRGRVRVGGSGEVIPDGASAGNVILFGEASSESILTLDSKTETINGLSAAGDTSLAVVTNNTVGLGTLRVGNNNATSTYAGRIADEVGQVALTKIGTGTLTISGASNTYTGPTTISAGTLSLGSTGSIGTSATITVNGGATYDVAGIAGYTVAGQTLVNNGTVNSAVAVGAGGTLVNNATLGGGVTANSGGVVSGSSYTTTVDMNAGSSIHPGASGADGVIGTLAMSTLNMHGADYRVDTAASNVSDNINVTTATFDSGSTITVAPNMVNGTFTILTATNPISVADQGNVALSASSFGRRTFGLVKTANTFTLSVSGTFANLTWNNTGGSGDGSTWDDQGNQNWNNVGSPDKFFQGDFVTFNDTNAGNYTVNLSGPLTPSSWTVTNNNGDYAFGGGGSIGGVASLIKNGTAVLTIGNSNSFTGGTTINAGTLKVTQTNALGTGPIVLNAGAALHINASSGLGTGTLTINGGTIDASAGDVNLDTNNPQVWGGSFTFAGTSNLGMGTGSITLNSNPTITVANNTLSLAGVIKNGSGTGFTKAGTGTLVLAAANTYTGAVNVNAGILRVSNNAAFGTNAGGVNVASGATVDLNNVVLNNTEQFNIAGAGVGGIGAMINNGTAGTGQNNVSKVALTANATIGGSGRWDIRANTPTLNLAGFTLTKVGANQIALNGVTVSSTGTTGLIDVTDGFISIEAGATMNTATSVGAVTIESGRPLQFFANTGTVNWPMTLKGGNNIGNASGTSATVASPMILQGDVTLVPLTAGAPNLAGNFPLVLNGNISDSGGSFGITKNGTALVTLGGSNTYKGGTTVSDGTLIVTKTYTGGGALSVNDIATLQLPHSAATPNNVVFRTSSITTNTSGRVDLSDNKLIVTTPGSAGTWNGSAYTGTTGQIASGRNGGGWGGSGIVTSQTNATTGNFTSIGIATASDVRPATATATALWGGQTITGTDTLVMYTYGGDATLDGKINIDDYVKIDTGIASNLTGWSNGDFNYDGKVNIDDYTTVIDANIGNQNGFVFPTAIGVDGVTAIPEPGAFGLVLFASLLAAGRERKRRARVSKIRVPC
jgi:autotransporter-associated beta strand protein